MLIKWIAQQPRIGLPHVHVHVQVSFDTLLYIEDRVVLLS